MLKSESKSSKPIVLISSDDEEFNVEEVVAMKSELLKTVFGNKTSYHYRNSIPLQLKEVPSEILLIVIDYCTKLVDEVAYEDLKAQFLQLEPRILFGLIVAASYMRIKSLLDITSQILVEIIHDLTPDEMFKKLEIVNDFTKKEAEDIILARPWHFMDKSSTVSQERDSFCQKVLPLFPAENFQSLTPDEKKKWVLAAVLIPHVRRMIAFVTQKYKRVFPTADEIKEASVFNKSSASETLELDLSDLFAENLNLNVKSKRKEKKKKKKKKNYHVT